MYCKIYIEAPTETLLPILEELFGGYTNRFSDYYFRGLSLHIRKNNEADLQQARSFPDGFLYFSLIAESDDAAISEINAMLSALWFRGIPAVAACDVEDQLSHSGGYRDSTLPWIPA